MSKLLPKEVRWTPAEIAVFQNGLMKVKEAYPQVLVAIEEFIGGNPQIRIESSAPDFSRGTDPWPFFYTFVPSYSNTRSERIIDNLLDSPDTPSLAIHPLSDSEQATISSLAGKISDIGFNVKPWRVFTEDHQIGAIRYKLTPYYQREKGQIVGASLRPKNS